MLTLYGRQQIIKPLHVDLDIEKLQQHGASTYHGALDIGAPQGADILALADGIVISAGWNGANRIRSFN